MDCAQWQQQQNHQFSESCSPAVGTIVRISTPSVSSALEWTGLDWPGQGGITLKNHCTALGKSLGTVQNNPKNQEQINKKLKFKI
ncbi:Bile pigment transporter 1 [Frankliniella fusca]|uniref:Bile pigment transporter 1 n=1 Tax=Frankliniella fusca TaxID=407009 RepID=A0AAE1H0W9_9NEOP|nr:Bile pigment transporter 1 [Frankliniella fusca]